MPHASIATARAAPAQGDEDASAPHEVAEPAFAAAIDTSVGEALAQHKMPGAVVVVGRHDGVLLRRAYGLRAIDPDPVPMTLDTVFDLASLTKPIATATSIMVMVERGVVGLDDRLGKYVPNCDGGGKGAITLRHLLLHVSGLPADISKESFAYGRDEALRRICALSLRAAPGTTSRYSDLGYMLLEEVVRRATGQELSTFARDAVFRPLGMSETGFNPGPSLKLRAAPTETREDEWMLGEVHDPRAYSLGGVAGHAGLFSTADDLVLYARAMLGGGAVDGRRILSRESAASMTAPYDVPGGVRTLGWDVDSRWRGSGLSPRAFGHFGYTGTALWIDPEQDLFVLLLSNRVHPDGAGDIKPLVARINTLAAAAVGPDVGRVQAPACDAHGAVLTGIDVLREEGFARLRGARVGLITNATGRARDGTSTIELLAHASDVRLVALFAPEHGLGTDRQGPISNGHDALTGLPIFSLYGAAFAPPPESLAGIDTLVFDVQDAGTRFFTYASTMRRAMQTAKDAGLRFVVLDRPDPIDGMDVGGPVLASESKSFVNFHALPVRHGMTIGELAVLFNADDHLGVDLGVVTMRGWSRRAYYDATGLPWVNPSPNLRSVGEVLLYPAVGLLEATNLSVGRGTDTPFEIVGAPWIDGDALTAALGGDALRGVAFAPTSFTPRSDVYVGEACKGVRITVTDRSEFEPVRTGLALARELRRAYPRKWQLEKLDRLLSSPPTLEAIDAGRPLAEIEATFADELSAFRTKRDKYLLYDADACQP